MTIDKIEETHDGIELEAICDGCTETYKSITETFHRFVEEIKKLGWKVVKNGSEWNHFCPSCKGKDV